MNPAVNWELIRNGDREEFLKLYQTYYHILFASGCYLTTDKELIRDTIQQLFLQLWQTKEKLPAIQQLKSYLVVALRNHLVTAMKERDKTVAWQPDTIPLHLYKEISYEEILIRKATEQQRSIHVQQAIRHLSPRYRQVIELKFFQQKSYAEIAALTGQSIKTTYTYIHEALIALRKLLREVNITA